MLLNIDKSGEQDLERSLEQLMIKDPSRTRKVAFILKGTGTAVGEGLQTFHHLPFSTIYSKDFCSWGV